MSELPPIAAGSPDTPSSAPSPVVTLVVDAANVIGSRPDGWWRDRAGAARRLAARLTDALADPAALLDRMQLPGERAVVHLVLEGAARSAAALAAARPGTVVVTADRGLRERAVAGGAEVVGPRTLLAALPSRA